MFTQKRNGQKRFNPCMFPAQVEACSTISNGTHIKVHGLFLQRITNILSGTTNHEARSLTQHSLGNKLNFNILHYMLRHIQTYMKATLQPPRCGAATIQGFSTLLRYFYVQVAAHDAGSALYIVLQETPLYEELGHFNDIHQALDAAIIQSPISLPRKQATSLTDQRLRPCCPFCSGAVQQSGHYAGLLL